MSLAWRRLGDEHARESTDPSMEECTAAPNKRGGSELSNATNVDVFDPDKVKQNASVSLLVVFGHQRSWLSATG